MANERLLELFAIPSVAAAEFRVCPRRMRICRAQRIAATPVQPSTLYLRRSFSAAFSSARITASCAA
jgi:hypothetical protein